MVWMGRIANFIVMAHAIATRVMGQLRKTAIMAAHVIRAGPVKSVGGVLIIRISVSYVRGVSMQVKKDQAGVCIVQRENTERLLELLQKRSVVENALPVRMQQKGLRRAPVVPQEILVVR